MTVTLRADADIQRLAKEAILRQNACNSCGLAQRFARVMKELINHPDSMGTSWTNQHPIARLWLGKLVDLARMYVDYAHYDEAYRQVEKLANGEEITVTMPEDR
jgi:hypothetical protein